MLSSSDLVLLRSKHLPCIVKVCRGVSLLGDRCDRRHLFPSMRSVCTMHRCLCPMAKTYRLARSISAFLQTTFANRRPTPLIWVRAYMILILPSTFVLSRLLQIGRHVSHCPVIQSVPIRSTHRKMCANCIEGSGGTRAMLSSES